MNEFQFLHQTNFVKNSFVIYFRMTREQFEEIYKLISLYHSYNWYHTIVENCTQN